MFKISELLDLPQFLQCLAKNISRCGIIPTQIDFFGTYWKTIFQLLEGAAAPKFSHVLEHPPPRTEDPFTFFSKGVQNINFSKLATITLKPKGVG